MFEYKSYPINKRPIERPIGTIEDSVMLTGITSGIKKAGAEIASRLVGPSSTDQQIAQLYKRTDEIIDKHFPIEGPAAEAKRAEFAKMVHESAEKVISGYSAKVPKNSSSAGTSPIPAL